MVAVRLLAVVDESRQLVVHVPDNIPAGPVELVIHSTLPVMPVTHAPLEVARAKLIAAGAMRPDLAIPANAVALTLQERIEAGQLSPGARPSEDLIREDRDRE
jgi:hypothetical protein